MGCTTNRCGGVSSVQWPTQCSHQWLHNGVNVIGACPTSPKCGYRGHHRSPAIISINNQSGNNVIITVNGTVNIKYDNVTYQYIKYSHRHQWVNSQSLNWFNHQGITGNKYHWGRGPEGHQQLQCRHSHHYSGHKSVNNTNNTTSPHQS